MQMGFGIQTARSATRLGLLYSDMKIDRALCYLSLYLRITSELRSGVIEEHHLLARTDDPNIFTRPANTHLRRGIYTPRGRHPSY